MAGLTAFTERICKGCETASSMISSAHGYSIEVDRAVDEVLLKIYGAETSGWLELNMWAPAWVLSWD